MSSAAATFGQDAPARPQDTGFHGRRLPGDAVGGGAAKPRDGAPGDLPITVRRNAFHVQLANFQGPFDLLLQLIGARRMDVTEVALSQVTDEFLTYLRELGDDADLGVVTEFLVVAATLLDLKAARLLPHDDEDSDQDLAILEARDLLFARLLAYKAYQQVATLFAELESGALRRYPRAVTLEQRYLGLLPEVRIGQSPARFAELAASVFRPPPAPIVSLDHIHSSTVSVAEHTAAMRELLTGRGTATFGELVAGCTRTLEVVARFLGLLDLYRESAVAFDQFEPLGLLTVRWTGAATTAAEKNEPATASDEEYE